MHPAASGELAHSCVDQRVASLAFAPGREALLVADPFKLAELLLVLKLEIVREHQQHVGVEVAPGELADESGGSVAATLLGSLFGLPRRDTAPTQPS